MLSPVVPPWTSRSHSCCIMLTLSPPPLLLFAELVISCLAEVLWLLSSCFHSAALGGGDRGGPYKRRRKLWEYRANTVLNIQRESRSFRPNRNSSKPVSKTQYSHWCLRHPLNLLTVHDVYSPLNRHWYNIGDSVRRCFLSCKSTSLTQSLSFRGTMETEKRTQTAAELISDR